jgi:hypothetical protein
MTNPLPMGIGFTSSGLSLESDIAWDQSKIGTLFGTPDPTSFTRAFLGEIGDLCKPSAQADGPDSSLLDRIGPGFSNVMLGVHSYLVYDIWSNSAGGCTLGPVVDDDLALSGLPSDQTVTATSANGAVVSYTPPTATDDDGETPPVSCAPAPGSTLGVGTTSVTCTATDADDSNSPVSQTFFITVTDSDLALQNVPANITTDATGPGGTVVNYTPPNATDEGGQTPPVSCAPAPGSTFGVGTTSVTCTATAADADDSNSPVSSSFTVHVKGAAEQLSDLANAVKGVGPGTSLADKVATIQSYLANGNTTGACTALRAFISQVEAAAGKSIPAATAAALIADAQRIERVVPCTF